MDIMKKIIVIINRIKISEGLLINDIISVLRQIVCSMFKVNFFESKAFLFERILFYNFNLFFLHRIIRLYQQPLSTTC